MQIIPSPLFFKNMNAESPSAILNTGEPELPSGAAASGPTSSIICLKPAHPSGNTLPSIHGGNVLLADRTLAAPRELVTGLLHGGTKGVLGGSSKAGKTWLLLDLAVSIATGTPFLKWPTIAGRVLFINLEILLVFIKERLQEITARKGLTDVGNLDFLNLRGQGADFETLLEQITERIKGERYALIILDPLFKLMVGMSENTAGSVGVLCHQIEQLIEKTGAAVVYAHHFTKGNAAKKKAMDRLSGSGVFARDADTIITFTEHVADGCYVLETTLRNFPPQPPFVVQWNFPIFVERPDLDPADLMRGDNDQDDRAPLLALLDEGPLTTGQWLAVAEAEGYSRPTFFRKKKQLLATKQVALDEKSETWSRVGQNSLKSQVSRVETETPETGEARTICPTNESSPVTPPPTSATPGPEHGTSEAEIKTKDPS